MKKMLVLLVVVMAVLSAHAQEMYLGGGISLWRNTDLDKTSFSITPDVGYELSEQWALGIELAYAHKGEEISTNAFALAPYARYSFYENKIVRLFLDMGFGFSTQKAKHQDAVNGFEIGVKPGMAIKLNHQFSLITKVGFAGYRDDYFRGEGSGFGVSVEGENISIGIDYEF
ncbi:outer membrane beta-barrel protein [Phocaeicola coprophilus]|jgi:hypothetical protein|uniref:outer membrane beta-barrel protein n=1 Tax=Phocaeicola coprophilus TaxID=387090 RepID=UPI0026581142|nr:outer membrane beta-barrel protein [Phocaeicola coprophilus]